MPLRPRPEGMQPLQQVRIARRLSQMELAEKIGDSQPTISRLETGTGVPTRLILARLCKVFGEKPERLFTKPMLDEVARRMKAQS